MYATPKIERENLDSNREKLSVSQRNKRYSYGVIKQSQNKSISKTSHLT